VVRSGFAAIHELVSHGLWEWQIGEPVTVKMAELYPAHPELDAAESMRGRAYPRPPRYLLGNSVVNTGHSTPATGHTGRGFPVGGAKRSNLLDISRTQAEKSGETDERMRRGSRPNESWTQGGSLIPRWVFWAVTAAVALASGLAIGYLGNPAASVPASPRHVAASAESPSPAATNTPGDRATPEPESSPTQSEPDKQPPPGPSDDLITNGVTVQVLNASGRGKGDNTVVQRLEQLGFSVVAINPAAKIYQKTTVFWSEPSGKAAAQALAKHFHWDSGPRPQTLSKSVTTHVVVGEDES
jgi:hypothetical protein